MNSREATPFRLSFIAFVAAAAAVNLWMFSSLDERVNKRYSAVHFYGAAGLVTIGREASPHFRQMHAPAFALNEIYPGATIIAYRKQRISRSAALRLVMLSYGRAKNIEHRDATLPASVKNFDYTPFVVASGEGGRRGRPFAIAAAAPPSGRFVSVQEGERDVFIDEALLPRDGSGEHDDAP